MKDNDSLDKDWSSDLYFVYDKGEAESIVRIINGLMTADGLIRAKDSRGRDIDLQLEKVINRLKRREPLDYILGHKPFMDVDILVNRHVLIPRPETEELVDALKGSLVNRNNEMFSVLDIGSGSGCISVAIKYYFPWAIVTGIDISTEAIELAQINADYNKVEINFKKANFLNSIKWNTWADKYDLIVSNPPYISKDEKEHMDLSVIQYEPEIALFPESDDPLIFYKLIEDFAQLYLLEKGSVFLECNAFRSNDIYGLYDSLRWEKIWVQDMSGNNRILKLTKRY